jgi:hypothetical protein
MSENVIQSSFAAGELSPSIYARVDLSKYHLGAATMRNFFVDYRSGASTRQGTKFIRQAMMLGTRLIRFQYSTVTSYVLEFGNQYVRFINNGASVLEPSFAISAVGAGTIAVLGNNFANNDWIFVTGLTNVPQANGRYYKVVVSGSTVTLFDVNGNAIDTSTWSTYTGGGTASRVYTIVSPYLLADVALLKFTQTASVMTITHPNYPPYTLSFLGPTDWVFTEIAIGTTIQPPTGVAASASTTGTSNYAYLVTSIDVNGQESAASAVANLGSAVDIGATAGTITVTWNSAPSAVSYNVYKAEISFEGVVPVGAAFGFIGSTQGTQFIDSNTLPDFTTTPPVIQNPFAPGQVVSITVSGGSGYTQSTTTVSITSATGSGFTGAVVVNSSGVPTNVIVQNPGQNYQATDTPVISDSSGGSGCTPTLTVGPETGVNPGATAYYQQRQVFAASSNEPETFWMSQPGNFVNFNISDPAQDDDAITGTIVSLQVNAIKSMLPMPGGLMCLTSNGAWQVSGGTGTASTVGITPANATAVPQAYNGASDVPPIVVNYDILYVQNKGSIVRDLAYNLYFNIYTGQDISVLSNHLFFGHTIEQWAYAEEPFKIIWAVREDGVLLSLCFVKEQEITGWSHHDTLGLFQSVTTVTENTIDATYLVVRRYINGQWVEMIERMADRTFPYGAEDAWSVDCGVQSGLLAPAANLTISASSGTATFTADAAVFSSSNVGSILRAGGGIATITQFVSANQLIGALTQDITATLPNDPNETPLPATSGSWSLTAPSTVFYGLDYLNGQTVSIIADGGVVEPQVVTNNSITLANPATKVTAGLAFQAQLQTMYLDVGEPTIQGKRKKISAVTVRAADTRGVKAGRTFATVVPIKELNPSIILGQPVSLVTADERIILDPLYDTGGQTCFQIDDPLPATILGVIPEVTIGDSK